jgi:hypothetical protein
MARSVIVLEFNELTPVLMDRFIDEGILPGFKRLRDQSVAAVTDAGEAPPNLEPWIQWITVHTGLSYAQHKVFALSDGPKLKAPRVWDMVSEAGKKVWVCGSMNAAVEQDNLRGLLIPDPWAVGLDPKPAGKFEDYVHLVRSYVQQYTSEKSPVTKADFLRFARFMSTNGLSLKTVMAALRQLASEKGGKLRWRRAAILDRLQWDMFRGNYQQLKPTFATFFLNSTAHFQHYYWRDHSPEMFINPPTPEHVEEHGDALRFGYRMMDQIVQECLELATPDTSIVLCTALGQQPLLKYEEMGGKQVFKCHDIPALLSFAGVDDPYTIVPVMAEEFQLRFGSADAARRVAERLSAVVMDTGEPLMSLRLEDATIFAGCAIISPPEAQATIIRRDANVTAPFDAHFYPLEGPKSGGHHPDGILWISTPTRASLKVSRKVSLQEIAPTLLALCEVDAGDRFEYAAMPEVISVLEPQRSAA